jgi:pyruvate formate lyase activating enzyme
VNTARIFDIQRFSVHDGPGIRTTLFLKGCPLRCLWCQNPEGLDHSIQLWHFANLCAATGRCAQVCPEDAIRVAPDGVVIDRTRCDLCGLCVAVCSRNALVFDGRDITQEDTLQELGADQIFHEVSGGGVTFSGGEPLVQAGFVRVVAAELKARGVATTIETSLCGPWASIRQLLDFVDYFIADLKLADSDAHLHATGVRNELIVANLGRLANALMGTGRILIRIPLIPRTTAVPENLSAIARLVESIDPTIPVELMNFNPLATAKYRRMGLKHEFANDSVAFSPDEMAEFRSIVAEHGLVVR